VTVADLIRLANGLKRLGVKKGTPVGIYLGMVPEIAIAMLACARLGAPHTVVFGGFSADSLSGRLHDMECEVLITQDEAWQRGTAIPLKKTADEALADSPTVKNVVVLRRTGGETPMTVGRDICGTSSRRATKSAHASRWKPRTSVGEPINPEARVWYREHIGGDRTPVVDTWWQTETGMILITPLSGVTTLKPGSATKPFPGVDAGVYEQGNEVGPGGGGYLVLRRPWPAMLRGIYKDPERYKETYWSPRRRSADATTRSPARRSSRT
jgi:acyl-coenzyme A synthetase/AMP-(fatty) acid ligase